MGLLICDMQIWAFPTRISDTQVTVKACWSLGQFLPQCYLPFFQCLISLPYICYMPNLVKIGPVVRRKSLRTTHDNGRKPVAMQENNLDNFMHMMNYIWTTYFTVYRTLKSKTDSQYVFNFCAMLSIGNYNFFLRYSINWYF